MIDQLFEKIDKTIQNIHTIKDVYKNTIKLNREILKEINSYESQYYLMKHLFFMAHQRIIELNGIA